MLHVLSPGACHLDRLLSLFNPFISSSTRSSIPSSTPDRHTDPHQAGHRPSVLERAAWTFSCGRSVPVIYTVFNPDFRRAFRRILRLDAARTDATAATAGSRGAAAGGGGGPSARSRSQNSSRQPVSARSVGVSASERAL